ncbi:MAG TPA: hypothetical protein DD640_07455 [Clostridiales bacterium]|nr:hypothetical protein [Clostridiales bacterium]
MAVLVASVRALKYNGGVARPNLTQENLAALEAGLPNLVKHIENIHSFGVPCLVALNHFATDTPAEIERVAAQCRQSGVRMAVSDVFSQGSAGGRELAESLLEILKEEPLDFRLLYPDDLPLLEKMQRIARQIYGAADIALTPAARKDLDNLNALGCSHLPVCMAKTQYSLSDNPESLGRPSGFTITVRELRLSAGAGFIVALTGDIMTLPGLPKVPAAEKIDMDAAGVISGLF